MFDIADKIDLIEDSVKFIDSSYEKYTSEEFYNMIKSDMLKYFMHLISLLKDKLEYIRNSFSNHSKTCEDIEQLLLKINNLKTYELSQINSNGKLLIKSMRNHPFKYLIQIKKEKNLQQHLKFLLSQKKKMAKLIHIVKRLDLNYLKKKLKKLENLQLMIV